jgi:hypothetical protein
MAPVNEVPGSVWMAAGRDDLSLLVSELYYAQLSGPEVLQKSGCCEKTLKIKVTHGGEWSWRIIETERRADLT